VGSPFEPSAPVPDTAGFLPPPPRIRFRHNYRLHITLFLLTLLTTTFCSQFNPVFLYVLSAPLNPNAWKLFVTWPVILNGMAFSVPLLLILTAHEFGHYFLCRYHKVDASLPYYLPLPLPPTGTLGAVIRIREAFPSKRALFDIGVAGPLAGFVALLPFLYWGISLSHVGPIPNDPNQIEFGEPLLFKGLAWLHFGPIRDGYEVFLHPIGFAGWWGMFVTALNLLPFGQLDGGHIAYSMVGRRAAYVSIAVVFVAFVLTGISNSWISITIMLAAMAFALGIRHPRVIDEDQPLDAARLLTAAIAIIVFIVCFTPVPIQMFLGR
jgi:membrane-associated protease RseP (regulator of RpoE activity)